MPLTEDMKAYGFPCPRDTRRERAERYMDRLFRRYNGVEYCRRRDELDRLERNLALIREGLRVA